LYKLPVADGESHMTNLIFAFCNFANAHGYETTFRHIQLPKPRRGGTVVHIKYRACGFWVFGLCSLLGSEKRELRFWMSIRFVSCILLKQL